MYHNIKKYEKIVQIVIDLIIIEITNICYMRELKNIYK